MDIMEQYSHLTPFLGHLLGENYEVALLDLREDKQCITAIANGHISGRVAGAPLTDLAVQIVNEGSWKTKDYLMNYTGMTDTKTTLLCSSFFIKENGKLLGMLCFNLDTSAYADVCKNILKLSGLLPIHISHQLNIPKCDPSPSETFSSNMTDALNDALTSISDPPVPANRLTSDERKQVIKMLSDDGFFLMRGAVSEIASRFNCSEATIYRYIGKIQKN